MKWLRRFLLLLCLLAAGAGILYVYADRYYARPGPLAQPLTLTIPTGTGFKNITRMLAGEGVITQPELFMGKIFLLNQQRNFKAGEYIFPAGASPKQVAEKLIAGDVIVHSVTLPEGLTSAEILAILAAEEALTGSLPATVEEGTLLPETYNFVRGDSRSSLLQRMRNAMTETLKKLWAERREGLPLSTPDDAVILASIVEKETGVPDERPRVAAVFLNRLKIGMKLQSDPTVIYGLWQQRGEKPARILKKDLATPTAYNTYLIPALPPGSIANPGKASLEAVLHAPVTDELYFVADGEGGHRFAKDLRQHNQNVRSWKKKRRNPQ